MSKNRWLMIAILLLLGLLTVQNQHSELNHSVVVDPETHAEIQKFFDILRDWNYAWYNQVPVPPQVADLNGKVLTITGYIYPMGNPSNLKTFLLTAHNIAAPQCLFCYSPPKLNEIIEVSVKDQAIQYTVLPIRITGKFFVGLHKGENGYKSLYRLEMEK